MKQCRSTWRVSALRGGRSRPWEIRAAMHPGWTASLTRSQSKEWFPLCHVWYTFCHFKAALCVAPRANSAAIPTPSARLASPAPRRIRCSRGFIHGLLKHPSPATFRSRRSCSPSSKGIERWHARNEVGAPTALANGPESGSPGSPTGGPSAVAADMPLATMIRRAKVRMRVWTAPVP